MRDISLLSVVFVITDIQNVIPAGGVMALETLINLRMFLACELLRDHREMLHEMTGRRLMALDALPGLGWRVLIAGYDP